MKVLNPRIYRPDMILIYKGSNQVIHNSKHKMTHQYASLKRSIAINGDEKLKECLVFKILDVTLMLVFSGYKVYEIVENEGEKVYIHLTNSYFYFKEIPDDKKIIIYGLFSYRIEYSEKCIIEEPFKYQIKFVKDSLISNILDESIRLFDEQIGMQN